MDDSLLEVVLVRLDNPDHKPGPEVEALVLAALESDEALAATLVGKAVCTSPVSGRPVGWPVG